MTQTEALKLALEFVEANHSGGSDAFELITAIKEALAQPAVSETHKQELAEAYRTELDKLSQRNYELRMENAKLKAQPEQEPVAWKLVPTEPTDEMLKAMDECSTEGYDERLYAGHAASVYMAAVDVAPTPPKPEQEPTKLWCDTCEGTGELYQEHQAGCNVGGHFKCPDCDGEGYVLSRLYSTTPPQRKPLTDEQVREIANQYALSLAFPYDSPTTPEMFARAIEAAHGIKE